MNTITQTIKAVIIDDQQLIVDSLSSLLNQSEEVEVIGYAINGADAAQLIENTKPDVAILDYGFTDQPLNGFQIADILSQKFPALKILMLTSYDDRALIEASFQHGIIGYVLKNADKEDLIEAIQKVFSNKKHLGPGAVGTILDQEKAAQVQKTSEENFNKDGFYPLTSRELEIALLTAQGMKIKQIADQLHISHNTVSTHRKRSYAKLELDNNNVAELINWLIKKELM